MFPTFNVNDSSTHAPQYNYWNAPWYVHTTIFDVYPFQLASKLGHLSFVRRR